MFKNNIEILKLQTNVVIYVAKRQAKINHVKQIFFNRKCNIDFNHCLSSSGFRLLSLWIGYSPWKDSQMTNYMDISIANIIRK